MCAVLKITVAVMTVPPSSLSFHSRREGEVACCLVAAATAEGIFCPALRARSARGVQSSKASAGAANSAESRSISLCGSLHFPSPACAASSLSTSALAAHRDEVNPLTSSSVCLRDRVETESPPSPRPDISTGPDSLDIFEETALRQNFPSMKAGECRIDLKLRSKT